jgi:drug/metabolite transporter (DMT)-like permease
VSWGFGISASKVALSWYAPSTLLALQLFSSVLFVGMLLVWNGASMPTGRTLILVCATGILEFGIAYGAGIFGLSMTTASSAALITATEPFLIMGFAVLLLKERFSTWTLVTMIAAAVGLVLVLRLNVDRTSLGIGTGDALLLAAAIGGAIYAIFSRQLVQVVEPLTLCALQLGAGLGFVLLVIFGFGLVQSPPISDSFRLQSTPLLFALGSGLLSFAVPFWLHLIALRALPASVFSYFLATVPLFGVAGAFLFLGERLDAQQMLGGVLLMSAVIAVTVLHFRTPVSGPVNIF